MATTSSLATVWLMMMRMFEQEGLDPAELLDGLGISAEQMSEPGRRFPSRMADIVFERACPRLSNVAFALHAARCWHPSNLGTMGYAWLSSSTLRTGLKRMERYARMLGERFRYTVQESSDGLRFVYDHGRGDKAIGPFMTDFTLSIIVDMCRTNFGGALNPVEVRLRRALPVRREAWDAFFGCRVDFGAAEDSFLLAAADADRRLPTAYRDMAVTFDRILTEQLAALTRDDLVTRCKAHLLEHLTSGEPSERSLAEAVGFSRRTLQRRLAEQGITYKRLVDETREALARRYLENPQRSLTEITFLLGFSEQSAFTRAFRRWHGESPSDYRRRRAQAPAG